jgi:hypothetical protein
VASHCRTTGAHAAVGDALGAQGLEEPVHPLRGEGAQGGREEGALGRTIGGGRVGGGRGEALAHDAPLGVVVDVHGEGAHVQVAVVGGDVGVEEVEGEALSAGVFVVLGLRRGREARVEEEHEVFALDALGVQLHGDAGGEGRVPGEKPG